MVAVACFVTPPPVALTVSARLPFFELLLTVTVSVDVPDPVENEAGLATAEIPVVVPDTVRVTDELKAPTGVTVTV